jgi:hypothetical protein
LVLLLENSASDAADEDAGRNDGFASKLLAALGVCSSNDM